MIIERLKYLAHTGVLMPNRYFWRTVAQSEVDYLEIDGVDGRMKACEFKWGVKKEVFAPKPFVPAYPNAEFIPVLPRNALSFIKN